MQSKRQYWHCLTVRTRYPGDADSTIIIFPANGVTQSQTEWSGARCRTSLNKLFALEWSLLPDDCVKSRQDLGSVGSSKNSSGFCVMSGLEKVLVGGKKGWKFFNLDLVLAKQCKLLVRTVSNVLSFGSNDDTDLSLGGKLEIALVQWEGIKVAQIKRLTSLVE